MSTPLKTLNTVSVCKHILKVILLIIV